MIRSPNRSLQVFERDVHVAVVVLTAARLPPIPAELSRLPRDPDDGVIVAAQLDRLAERVFIREKASRPSQRRARRNSRISRCPTRSGTGPFRSGAG